MKLAVLAPYGVHPPRSAGHNAVLSPLVELARRGHRVDLITSGLRRFERRLPLPFRTDIVPGLVEHRQVSPWRLAMRALRGATRLPHVGLSEELHKLPGRLLATIREADIVQVESPWAFPFVAEQARGPVAFVAHNVETDLHRDALRSHGGDALVARANEIEGRAFREADLVFAFLAADLERLEELHGRPAGTTAVDPLSTDVTGITPAGVAERTAARRELGLSEQGCVALFAASAHAPNVAAAACCERVAARTEEAGVTVVIAGSVEAKPRSFAGGVATGPLESLCACHAAADLALNPMLEGSGMNQKVSEYLAWGLPVLSSALGARGFDAGEEHGLLVIDPDRLAKAIVELAGDGARRARLGSAARRYAERKLSWESSVDRRLAAYEGVSVSA